MNKKLRTFVYPVCAFIVLLLLWQVCVMLSTSEIAFPTPVAVFKEFFYILTHTRSATTTPSSATSCGA